MFHYSNRDLYCEGVPLADIAREAGTPAYVYSSAAILENYRAYDEAPAPNGADTPEPATPLRSATEIAAFLRGCRNDLEAAAVRLRPRIGEALGLLAAQPETMLARMSGSGATCFALCADAAAAARLEARLSALAPAWWVRRTVLTGSNGL